MWILAFEKLSVGISYLFSEPQSLINEANRIPSLTRGCRTNDKMPSNKLSFYYIHVVLSTPRFRDHIFKRTTLLLGVTEENECVHVLVSEG